MLCWRYNNFCTSHNKQLGYEVFTDPACYINIYSGIHLILYASARVCEKMPALGYVELVIHPKTYQKALTLLDGLALCFAHRLTYQVALLRQADSQTLLTISTCLTKFHRCL